MNIKNFIPFIFILFFISCKNNQQKDDCCKKEQTNNSKLSFDSTISLHDLQSEWTTQDGQKVTLADFHKKATVVAMIFTNCQSACPRITADIQRIENEIPAEKRKDVSFVLISMDLNNWTLLTGAQNDVEDIAGVLNVRINKQADGSFDHSNIIHILNSNGNIVHQQIGLAIDPKESSEKLKLLLQ
jgi:protein SCO1/2